MAAKSYKKGGKTSTDIAQKMMTADEKQPSLKKMSNAKEPRWTDYGKSNN